ncbi:MATH domain and coiled-coil domain-containing protein At3g58370-like [Cornus florida]|uniref:MATH domain and coiled-coil domain-containing protein At3g58370-like n=1 Tax=Cornus florida TaxID=4283 RepID=UPI00289E8B3A|nr:MATH domain and coiled-coil domain-containing protein At3g58370-like [Cornus florida]
MCTNSSSCRVKLGGGTANFWRNSELEQHSTTRRRDPIRELPPQPRTKREVESQKKNHNDVGWKVAESEVGWNPNQMKVAPAKLHNDVGLKVAENVVGWNTVAPEKLPNDVGRKVAEIVGWNKVAQAKTAKTVAQSRFTWKIENFSKLNTEKLYSVNFSVGGHKWRVLIFPKGNKVVDHLSIYLDVPEKNWLLYGWSRCAEFSFSVINQIDNKLTVKEDTKCQFDERHSNWGFSSFMPLSELHDPGRGYLVNDICIVEADIVVEADIDDSIVECRLCDTKRESGHVELEVKARKKRRRKVGAMSSSSFDDMDAYISKLVSVVEPDAPFDSTTGGSVVACIPQPTVDEAKKFLIKMLSRDLSEIPDFAAHLTESMSVLSDCCDLTPAQLAKLNSLKIKFPTLLKTCQTSIHSLKEVEVKMAEKQGTKESLVERVKINALAFQMQRAIHKSLIADEAKLQQQLAKISEKKRSAEREIKQLHGKMVNIEQSRSSVLEEISTLETEKKTAESSLSSAQQKWSHFRHMFM